MKKKIYKEGAKSIFFSFSYRATKAFWVGPLPSKLSGPFVFSAFITCLKSLEDNSEKKNNVCQIKRKYQSINSSRTWKQLNKTDLHFLPTIDMQPSVREEGGKGVQDISIYEKSVLLIEKARHCFDLYKITPLIEENVVPLCSSKLMLIKPS